MDQYHIYNKYWDKQASANRVYLDKMKQNAASDQGFKVCHSEQILDT